MGRPIAHFEILGSNPAQLQEFYTAIFGWSLKHPVEQDDPRQYAMIATNSGEAMEGGIGKSMEGTPAVNFYIDVEALGETLAAIEAGGGRTVMPPLAIGHDVSIALFSDPGGNVLGLVHE
ncbi:MAG: VOC family protein [Actinomycetota bacterium]